MPNIWSVVAIIPRPPNEASYVSQLYLLASASGKPIAVNAFAMYCQVHLFVFAEHYGAIKIAQSIRANYAPVVYRRSENVYLDNSPIGHW